MGLFKKKKKEDTIAFKQAMAEKIATHRIRYVAGFLEWLEKAIDEGYDVRGYYLWSLMDNFEWSAGYNFKFGIMSCDREGNTAWKKSAHFYKDFIKAHK